MRVQTLSSGALIRTVFSIFPNLFPHLGNLLKVGIKVNPRARNLVEFSTLRARQEGVPGTGDYPLHNDTCYAIELNVKKAVPEWGEWKSG